MLKLMYDEVEVERTVMRIAFHDNLTVLKKSLDIMCDMSQPMSNYYVEKCKGRRNPPSAPTRATCNMISKAKRVDINSHLIDGVADKGETATTA